MSKRSRLREGAYTLLFMLVVTSVFIAATSATYLATRERVERNKKLYIQRAIMRAAGIAPPADDAKAAELFATSVAPEGPEGATERYRVATPVGAALVFLREGAGLWGTIGAAVGFTEKLDGTMTGIAFTSQNETPGLGARIEEEWFTKQFTGKRGPFTTRPEGEPTELNEFDAITGATITTNAVRDLINEAIRDAPNFGAPSED